MFDFARAFDPLFDETVKVVAVRQTRTIRGAYAACIFPVFEDAAFGEDCVQSERKRYTVLISRRGSKGWNESEPPRIGDEVEFANGQKAKVIKAISVSDGWYSMEVREC